MEEAIDFSPSQNETFASILGFAQDRDQAGEYTDYNGEELFSTPIRHMNIGDEDSDDDIPVNLGTSCINLNGDHNLPNMSQRDLLGELNILRPRNAQGQFKSHMDCQMRDDQDESEFGKNFQLSAPAGGAHTGYDEAYKIICSDAIPTRIPGQNWIQEEQPQMNEVMTGDRDLVDIYSQDWRSPENISVVKIEEKAATAADRFLDTARQQTGLSTMRDDHLDGPVFSNFTSEEDEVGQYVDYSVSSDEFECDGNCYTSLTDNSRE
ncbi:unnamed protein product [Moneuplotes crassus]|uniref:Uncharacterized protein n=1 Tax=Euplotes crassus TaxID=5936 RepID=A0AAD1XDL6_EUPCR|nr:unnamed protein product [Moneuplotes crassus]